MMKINVAGNKYKVPTHWEDITISQCAWLYDEVSKLPVELQDYYRSFASSIEPQVLADSEELALFSLRAIEYLANIPLSILGRVERGSILKLSAAILPRFACGVMGFVDYPIRGAEYFSVRGRKYYYPASSADIMGAIMPLSGMTAVEFCQVSDIVVAGNLALAPLALSISCRPRGDAYDETTAQSRALLFTKLPMSTYWELWAQVSGAHEYLRASFPDCYGVARKDVSDEDASHRVSWCDVLVELSVNKPSDLPYLQQMNSYDFIHLLSENIKKKTEEWKMNAALSAFGAR